MKLITLSSFLALTIGSMSFACFASTGEPFYGDPPDQHHAWCVHDWNRAQPPRVEPKPLVDAKPPTDAVVLFDGTEASVTKWEADKSGSEPTQWIVTDGVFQCVPKSGFVRTKEKFGDCHLHIEWASPTPPQGESQRRGNSGIFLMGLVEIQVLDNYDNPTYADGFACSVYGVNPPLANALRPPGEWQQIDIEYRHPVYEDNRCVAPGLVTVYCNGVLVQDHTQLEGSTGHKTRSKPGPFPEVGPLKLQDHGNPVRYRNIWYQPLPPRTAADVVKHGPLSTEESLAKRKETAATVRESAQQMPAQSVNQLLRLAESLVYEKDEATYNNVERLAVAEVASIKTLSADQIQAKKDEVKRVFKAFQYLAKFKIIDADDTAWLEIASITKAHGWEK
jgi:hypothetical protein